MKTKLTFLLSLTFLFLFSGSVYCDDFQDGMNAIDCKTDIRNNDLPEDWENRWKTSKIFRKMRGL